MRSRSLAVLFATLLLSTLLAACEGDGGAGLPGAGGDDVAAGVDTGSGGGGGTCTPACDGRVCGPDGCGGTCAPGCGASQVCNDRGLCEFDTTCVANCTGKACGDDGCGGTCGTCAAGQSCNAAGQCVVSCQPSCEGRACGDNGCGGSCGTCADGLSCDAAGQCVPNVCTPDCAGRQCGADPVCGQSCGTCGDGYACADGACVCQPDCSGRVCGDDGCGGSCGGCADDETCNALGACVDAGCVPDCTGVVCGPDPVCGQDCGGCADGEACVENQCVCVPSCVGVQCGDNGCGGSCGSCGDGLTCVEGVCACIPSCDGRTCGSDGCGGSCGTCPDGETCSAAGQCSGGGTCTPDCAGKECGGDGCGGTCGSCGAGETCNAAGACVGTTAPAGVDTACASDADCGAGGTCLDFDGYFPNGYCSIECSATECPEGSDCWNLGEEVGSYCLHACAASDECRDGYFCDGDNTCWPGEEPEPGTGLVGTACTADADCDGGTCYPETYDGQPTGFTGGYCVVFDCSEQAPCPSGSACYQLQDGGTVCLDTCGSSDDCREGYACESQACLPSCTEGSCPDGYVCNADSGLCEEEPCLSDTDCDHDMQCVEGRCVVDVGDGPGAGPGPACDDLPPLYCDGTAAYCGELVPFEPKYAPAYEDYPLNGETESNQYRSYIRRDVMMAIKYASAKVLCKLGDWDFGLGGPIGLGDMSEADGAIPGASVGSPGHPEGTHTNGFDMDLGYYQVSPAPDNKLRAICDHYENGQEAYHCTAAPHLLDPWRTALFFAYLAENDNLRVIGCDGQAGPMIDSALTILCDAGWTPSVANCANPGWYDFPVTYETENGGAGWFYFHHHHFHVSFSSPNYNKSVLGGPSWCLTAECDDVSVLPLERFDLQRSVRTLPTRTLRALPTR